MKKAMCHYSFHRRWAAEAWDAARLCEETKAVGVSAIDFHGRLLGEPQTAAAQIRSALERTGLELSGLSLSNDFLVRDADEVRKTKEEAIEWLRIAAEVRAPVARVFGGHALDRQDEQAREAAFETVANELGDIAREAERLGLTLALENHGGMPATGEEQVRIVEAVGSPNLRLTLDLGNYLAAGQDALEDTRVAAFYCAYVHLKDCRKVPDYSTPWGYRAEACVVGEGDVDIPACLDVLRQSGYTGYVALEYEGAEPEATGVPKSARYMDTAV